MTHKFFQHVDQYDKETFLNVVELSYIDDTDPSMVLYYFDDGTKCNAEFIKDSNETTVETIDSLAFVQVTNRSQIWKCNITETKAKERKARTANGEEVVVPDRSMFNVKGEIVNDVIKYNWVKPISKKINNDDILLYYITTITNFLETGELPEELYNPNIHDLKYKWGLIYTMEQITNHIPNYVIPEKLTAKFDTYLQECSVKTQPKEISQNITESITVTNSDNSTQVEEEEKEESNKPYICKLIDDRTAEISQQDNGTYIIENDKTYLLADLIDAYNNLLQSSDIPVEKQPETPKYNISSANKETVIFLSNMIANATKKTAEASVSIELDVPPFDVYKLLKTAYPEDWANIFIDLIATSVSPDDLQSALGEGLKAYYDSEMENHN